MRGFIAIALPQPTQKYLKQITEQLRKEESHARWVASENLHLTLKFLGDAKEHLLDEIKTIMQNVSQAYKPFTVQLSTFDCFPNAKKPCVFFVTINQESILRSLAQTIENKLAPLGFKEEHHFKAHITLARFKSKLTTDRLIDTAKTIPLNQSFPVTAITLFKSTLDSTGPHYQILFQAPFQEAND